MNDRPKSQTFFAICSTALLLLIGLAPATRGAFGVSFNTSIDTFTAIPGGTGNFTDFRYAPGISDGTISFMGLGSSGQIGLYYKIPTDPCRPLVDLNTAIPGGIGNFINFAPTDPCINGDLTVFLGEGSDGQLGVYVKRPGDPYRLIADRNTTIPDGTGNFTGFMPVDLFSPSVSGDNVAFYGSGDSGQQGIYVSYPTDPIRVVADLNTAIPNGTGNFIDFLPRSPILPPSPIISGDAVAFIAFGDGGQTGIYQFLPPSPIIPDGSLTRLANRTTLIPDDGRSFEFFQSVSMDGTNVAFVGGISGIVTSDGTYTGQLGVYKNVGSGWQVVADLNTNVPGSSSPFTGFGTVAIDPGYVVFDAYDQDGVHGIYTDFAGELHKIVAIGDTIGGKTLTDFYWSQFGFSVGSSAQVAFLAEYADDSKGIMIATLTNGPCPLSQGYWKNNPRPWPVSSLTLGSQTYMKSELLNILKTSTTSDASMILARQLIAAKLNIASGSGGTPVTSRISDADSLLSQFVGKLPYKVKTTSTIGKAMVNDATTLNNYNNGQLTQFCGQ